MEDPFGNMFKITDSNYSMWKSKIRDILVVKDLWLPVQFGDERQDKINALTWEVMHFDTVYSSRIPFDRWYSSNCPRYSPPLSARTTFTFWSVYLLTLAWNSSKMENTGSFGFTIETHIFWLWSSMKGMKYCAPACDFMSTWHTSVCTGSS